MTEQAPPNSISVDLDPVAAHFKRLADHHAGEALMLSLQLRDALALLKQLRAEAADEKPADKPKGKKD